MIKETFSPYVFTDGYQHYTELLILLVSQHEVEFKDVKIILLLIGNFVPLNPAKTLFYFIGDFIVILFYSYYQE